MKKIPDVSLELDKTQSFLNLLLESMEDQISLDTSTIEITSKTLSSWIHLLNATKETVIEIDEKLYPH